MFVKRVVGRNGRLRLRVPTVEALAGLVCTAGVLALTGSTASAQAQPRAALADEFGSGVRVALHEETGRVGFVGTEPGGPIGRPPGLSRTARPEAAARAFLSAHGGAFGLGPSATLRLVDERTAPGRRSSLRFQQLLDGVPVLGGELIVNLDDRRRILSASGETEPASAVDTTPMVPARDAAELARQVVARQYGAGAGDLEAGEPALSIYAPALLGGPDHGRPRLVWRVDVTAGALEPLRELVLIDAQLGVPALHFNQLAYAKARYVCDRNNVVNPSVVHDRHSRAQRGPPTHRHHRCRLGLRLRGRPTTSTPTIRPRQPRRQWPAAGLVPCGTAHLPPNAPSERLLERAADGYGEASPPPTTWSATS